MEAERKRAAVDEFLIIEKCAGCYAFIGIDGIFAAGIELRFSGFVNILVSWNL